MDIDDSHKPDEKLIGEEKGDDFIGFGTGQNNVAKIIAECPDILQTAVVSNKRFFNMKSYLLFDSKIDPFVQPGKVKLYF